MSGLGLTPVAADRTVKAIVRAVVETDREALLALYHCDRSADEWRLIVGSAISELINALQYMEEVGDTIREQLNAADIANYCGVDDLVLNEGRPDTVLTPILAQVTDQPDDPLERKFFLTAANNTREE